MTVKGIRRVYLCANEVGNLGGIGTFQKTLGEGLAERGYEVTYIGINPAEASSTQEYFQGQRTMTAYDAPVPGDWQLRTAAQRLNPARRLRNRRRLELRARGIERLAEIVPEMTSETVVISAQVYAMEHLLEAGLPLSTARGPLTFGMYHDSFAECANRGDLPRVKRSYPDLDKFFCLTEADRVQFTAAGLSNVDFVPNPVPETHVADTPREQTVISLGRYHEQKALPLLIEAWGLLTEEHPDWRLRLFGEGPEEAALARLIADRGLGRSVTLEGSTNQAPRELAAAKIHAMSSRHEGLPLAIVEASRAGVPTVAFNCAPGMEVLVDSGRTGVLVPPGHVAGLAKELSSLMADDERRERLGAAAREASLAYLPETILDRWEDEFVLALR